MSQKLVRFWAILLVTELFFNASISLSVQPESELGSIIISQNIEANPNVLTKEKALPTSNKVQSIKSVHKRLSKDLKAHAARKNQTITCAELQNYTFTNDPPFDVLGIPECAYQVQPQMMLYLPPINKTQMSSFIKSRRKDSESDTTAKDIFKAHPSGNEKPANKINNGKHRTFTPAEKDSTTFDEDWRQIDIDNLDKDASSDPDVNILLNGEENKMSLKDQLTKTKYVIDSNLDDEKEEYSDSSKEENSKITSNTTNEKDDQSTQNFNTLEIKDELELLMDTLQCELIPTDLPNNVTDSCLRVLNARTDLTKVVIIIHGYLNSFQTGWMHQMQSSIQALEPHTAIIVYGWGRGLQDIWNYWRAARNARYAARALYEMIKTLQENVSRKLYIHCAGHSLGAHVCGIAGKYLIALDNPKVRKFNRISGMDPAGPMFCNDVPYPFSNLNIEPSARLGPTDGDLVDVIHTDGNARYLDYIPQYGTLESLGTVDFYPGYNSQYYGCYQPGCYDVVDVVSCSHSRSHMLYAASIDQAVCMASRKCDGNPHIIPKNCTYLNSTTDHELITMGYWLNVENPPTGLYTIEVDGYAPFCI